MQGDVVIAGQPLVYVSWACRRCGHTGGMARTTIPLGKTWSEELGRIMFAQLRLKLVRVHQNRHSCIAVPDDFVISRFEPDRRKEVVGVV